MKHDDQADFQNQLKHWHQRKESLIIWLEVNGYEHPNFNQNLSDLRAAECKIIQINDRINRPTGAATANCGVNSMALPIINMHYSF